MAFDKHARKFHVVWNPEGGAPTKRYTTATEAREEAERLARCNPGQEFVVLTSDSSFQTADIITTHFG